MNDDRTRMLFMWMAAVYGHTWTSQYADSDLIEMALAAWTEGTEGLSDDQVEHGRKACLRRASAFPPSLPEFIGMCADAPLSEEEARRRIEHKQAREDWEDEILRLATKEGIFDPMRKGGPQAYVVELRERGTRDMSRTAPETRHCDSCAQVFNAGDRTRRPSFAGIPFGEWWCGWCCARAALTAFLRGGSRDELRLAFAGTYSPASRAQSTEADQVVRQQSAEANLEDRLRRYEQAALFPEPKGGA